MGVIISKNKVQMDEEKLSGVLEWPVPTKVKQVQAFLGFANFYRRFIENFAKMSKPLSNLTKKDCTWNWGVEQQNAFEALKKAFTIAPVLRIPNDEDVKDGILEERKYGIIDRNYTLFQSNVQRRRRIYLAMI